MLCCFFLCLNDEDEGEGLEWWRLLFGVVSQHKTIIVKNNKESLNKLKILTGRNSLQCMTRMMIKKCWNKGALLEDYISVPMCWDSKDISLNFTKQIRLRHVPQFDHWCLFRVSGASVSLRLLSRPALPSVHVATILYSLLNGNSGSSSSGWKPTGGLKWKTTDAPLGGWSLSTCPPA